MNDVDSYLGPGGHIAGRLPDYEERPEQIELARAISAALSGGRHLLAEAGVQEAIVSLADIGLPGAIDGFAPVMEAFG